MSSVRSVDKQFSQGSANVWMLPKLGFGEQLFYLLRVVLRAANQLEEGGPNASAYVSASS
jgi:hypothetical protein